MSDECNKDGDGIYINPNLHKTPKQWVEFFEEEFNESYPGDKSTIFAGWFRRGIPKKFGGGSFKVYYTIDARTKLYKWVKD